MENILFPGKGNKILLRAAVVVVPGQAVWVMSRHEQWMVVRVTLAPDSERQRAKARVNEINKKKSPFRGNESF